MSINTCSDKKLHDNIFKCNQDFLIKNAYDIEGEFCTVRFKKPSFFQRLKMKINRIRYRFIKAFEILIEGK